MGSPKTPSRGESDPLAGVLDRLIERERGTPAAKGESLAPQPPRGTERVETPADVAETPKRMLAVAGLGADEGMAALRSAAQWGLLIGRRPSVVDLFCRGQESRGEARPGPVLDGVLRARVPSEPDGLRREPPELVAALLEKLRRQESSSSLLLVRVPIRHRRVLMRAALLAGALVLPVDESEDGQRLALDLSREMALSFLDVRLWPFSESPRALARYVTSATKSSEARVVPFDPGQLDLAADLRELQEPPDEGFLGAVLAPAPAELPPRILEIDCLPL